jgi:hypothetical protein
MERKRTIVMKKILIVALVLVASAGGAFWFFHRTGDEAILPAQLLPRETLAMIETVDLPKSLHEFKSGPLGQALGKIDLEACLQSFDTEPEAISSIARLQAQAKDAMESPWFGALFGDLAVIAVLAPDTDATGMTPDRLWRASAVLILQSRQPSDMIRWIGMIFSTGVTVASQTTNGVRMDRIETPDGPPLFVATHRGLTLAALDPAPIVRCLAPAGDSRPSLADSADYVLLRKESGAAEETRCFAWVHLSHVLDLMADLAKARGDEKIDPNKIVAPLAAFTRARPVMAATASTEGGVHHQRWRVRFTAEDLAPETVPMIGVRPQPNPTLAWMPESLMYYSWHNNLRGLLASVLNLSHLDTDNESKFKENFSARTGVEVEKAVGALGGQLAFLIRDIRMGGILPVPELALMVETGQPETIDRMVETIVRNSGMAMETEALGATTIRYLALPQGEALSPAYAVENGFAILASNRDLLKTLLDREKNTRRLPGSALFKAVDRGLSDPNNRVDFLRPDQAAARLKEMLDLGLSLAMMSGKQQDSRRIAYLSDNVLVPILDALSAYKAVGSRTISEGRAIQTDVYVLKPSPP